MRVELQTNPSFNPAILVSNSLLLEGGGRLLLETGDYLLLEV